MKLRLRGESLRLRLTSTEVTSLRDQGWWQDATTFGGEGAPRLAYRVESAAVETPTVRFVAGPNTTLTAVLPAADVVTWANSDTQVGLYFEAPWGLKVAIEKDFRCLDPDRDEDESDNFDNPNAGSTSHTACHAE